MRNKPKLTLDIGEIDALIQWREYLIKTNKFNIKSMRKNKIDPVAFENFLKRNTQRLNELIKIKYTYWPK